VAHLHSDSLDREVQVEQQLLSPFLAGRAIRSFRINQSDKVVLIPYTLSGSRMRLIPEDELKLSYPAAHEYLSANKAELVAIGHLFTELNQRGLILPSDHKRLPLRFDLARSKP